MGYLFLLSGHFRKLQSTFKRSRSLRYGKLLSRRRVVLLREAVHVISVAVVNMVGCRAEVEELDVHRHCKTNLNHDLLVGFISAFASTCCSE